MKMTQKESKMQNYQGHLEKISQGADLIPGIYNYCDRWCERCPKTKNCSIYYMEQEDLVDKNVQKKDLDHIADIFTITMELLQEMADELGVDLNEIGGIEIPDFELGKLELIAHEYQVATQKWIVEKSDSLSKYTAKLILFDEEKADVIQDILHVINWYGPIIGAKIHRAMSKSETRVIDDIIDFEYQDRRGSAKVALIAMDRSIGAMKYVLNNLQEEENSSLSFLASLSKMKRLLLNEFPDAMSFIRPGFDE